MIAFVFPGQGSQKQGMGQEFFELEACRPWITEIEDATGRDLKNLCLEMPDEELRQTQNAQLALFSVGAISGKFVQTTGTRPDFLAGHSVGEYAALAVAGYLTLGDAAKAVAKRGELMANAGSLEPGSMAAVLGLDLSILEEICAEVEGVVIANDNCPGQTVLSGSLNGLEKASALATKRGARKVMPLNVSGAFHSPLMGPASKELGAFLTTLNFEAEAVPTVANFTAKVETKGWDQLLVQQLVGRVRWTETIQEFGRLGVTQQIELGSGDVLSGLCKRIDPSIVPTRFRVQTVG